MTQVVKVALQSEDVDSTAKEVKHFEEEGVEGVGEGKAVSGGVHQPFIPLPGCPC